VKNSYVIFDRDGTLILHKHHLTSIAEVEFVPHLRESLQKLLATGYRLGIATNQSVVSRGLCTEDNLKQIHNFLSTFLSLGGIDIEFIVYCPHTKESKCKCRKPLTGMITQEIASKINFHSSWMVGDAISDIEFGHLPLKKCQSATR
jgi:D-glycero-D-manno-heptose 1,7-bisphosphate phosphatase